MDEGHALDIEKINAKGHVTMMVEDMPGKDGGDEGGDVFLARGIGGVSFDVGDVRAIDVVGALDVLGSDRAVAELVGGNGVFEDRVVGPANEDGTAACGVGITELAAGELLFEIYYCGDKGVGVDGGARRVIVSSRENVWGCVGVQTVGTFGEVVDSAGGGMDMDDWRFGSVEDDAAGFADVGEGEDVAERFRIEPNGKRWGIKTNEVSLLMGDKRAPLGGKGELVGRVTDVLDMGRVFDHGVAGESVDEEKARVERSIRRRGRTILMSSVGLAGGLGWAVGALVGSLIGSIVVVGIGVAVGTAVVTLTVTITIIIVVLSAGGSLLEFLGTSQEPIGGLECHWPLVGTAAVLGTEVELEFFKTDVAGVEDEMGGELSLLYRDLGGGAALRNSGSGVGTHARIWQRQCMVRSQGDNHFLELVIVFHGGAIALLEGVELG